MYSHLKLTEWPFRTVPDENYCSFLADRTQFRTDLGVFLDDLSIQPASSIHLMWAWFGAGKTHTLRYLEYQCRKKIMAILPIYMEFPRSVTKFIDLYKLFINRPLIELVDDIYSKIYGDKLQKEIQHDFPDLSKALMLHVAGDDNEQDVAIRWLKAECKEIKILKNIGISKPISSAEEAIKAISWIFRLIFEGSRYIINAKKRILWMIDEFQRIEDCRPSALREINSCLLSIFNRCPNSLTMIISFSGYPDEANLPSWLSPEIKDRVGINPFFLLPPLSEDDAFLFVKDILCHFRDQSTNIQNELFPFNEKSIGKVIKLIKEKAKESNRSDQPKPRTIMQFFDKVLKIAYPQLKTNRIEIINSDLIDEILRDINLPPE